MPNYLDAHLSSSMQSEANLNTRKMWAHLFAAGVFGILPAASVYMIADKLDLYDAPDDRPCIPDMGLWLVHSGYIGAAYGGIMCFLLFCVVCTPGGEASTMQKMVRPARPERIHRTPSTTDRGPPLAPPQTCLMLTAKACILGSLAFYGYGQYEFYTKVDKTVCDAELYDAVQYYLYGSYGALGLCVLAFFVGKALTARKGAFKKAVTMY